MDEKNTNGSRIKTYKYCQYYAHYAINIVDAIACHRINGEISGLYVYVTAVLISQIKERFPS